MLELKIKYTTETYTHEECKIYLVKVKIKYHNLEISVVNKCEDEFLTKQVISTRSLLNMARNYGHARFAHVSDFPDNGGPMPYVYS